MTPRRLVALAAAASFVVAACGTDAPAPREMAASADVTAVIQTFRYEPETLRLSVGETVRWENGDDILHTVTSGVGRDPGVPGVSPARPPSPSGVFDGRLDGEGSDFSFTFDEAGTFGYFCTVHSGMAGTVIVG